MEEHGMKLQVGQTLHSAVDSTALIVIRGCDLDLTVTCGGEAMAPQGEGAGPLPASAAMGGGALIGKRYTVDGLEIELLCVKGGEYAVAIDGTELVQKGARPLPASD
jgi:hypothetical protein